MLDAAGRCTIYLPPTGSFLYQLKTAAGVLVDDQEPIIGSTLGVQASTFEDLLIGLVAWPGSEASALLGVAVPAGSTDVARAPGTGFFTLAVATSITFEATLWAAAGATATVGIYKTSAPDAVIAGSALTSVSATGALQVIAAPIVLVAGTYLIKGHSGHATLQAWGVTYRVRPDT